MNRDTTKYSRFTALLKPTSKKHQRSRMLNASFAGSSSITQELLDEAEHRGSNASFCCARERLSSESTVSTSRSSNCEVPLPQNLYIHGWMYWARPEETKPRSFRKRTSSTFYNGDKRYTKVYAVLRNEFLLLYRDNHASNNTFQTPIVQIAVNRAGRTIDGVFHVQDPFGHEMELHLYNRHDDTVANKWELALEQASDLTYSHFAAFDVQVDRLARNSVYRGTLHEFRTSHMSFRQAAQEKLRVWTGLRPVRAARATNVFSRTSAPVRR